MQQEYRWRLISFCFWAMIDFSALKKKNAIFLCKRNKIQTIKKISWNFSPSFILWSWNSIEVTYFYLFKYTLKLGWVLVSIELYALCAATLKRPNINMWCNNRYLNLFGIFCENMCHELMRESRRSVQTPLTEF